MRIAEYTICIMAAFFHYSEIARGASLSREEARQDFGKNSPKIGAVSERQENVPTLAETAELLQELRDAQRQQQRFYLPQQQMMLVPLDSLTASHLLHNTVDERSEVNPDIYRQFAEEQQQLPYAPVQKRAQTFVRFGKRAQTFVRFG